MTKAVSSLLDIILQPILIRFVDVIGLIIVNESRVWPKFKPVCYLLGLVDDLYPVLISTCLFGKNYEAQTKIGRQHGKNFRQR